MGGSVCEHFSPLYPTWPIRPEAFKEAPNLTPRALIRRVDSHVKWCLDRDEIIELDRLIDAEPRPTEESTERKVSPSGGTEVDLKPLDDRFAELVASVEVGAALDPKTEDAQMPALLAAGLAAWIDEQTPTGKMYKRDPLPPAKPALHGRLIEVLNEATENEAHWGFRAVASTNAVAVINRVRAACTMAGLDPAVPQRKLVVLRKGGWPSGKCTKEITDGFVAAGRIVHEISVQDLKVFTALREMSTTPHVQFQEWLVVRRHASGTNLFRDVLGDRGATSAETADPQAHGGGEAEAQPLSRPEERRLQAARRSGSGTQWTVARRSR